MRKERLKSIKRKTVYLEGTDYLMMAINTDDYRWLLKQAERVQELEKENKELESLAKMQHDAKIEIEKRCLELEEKLKDQIDSNWKLDKINRMWLRENKRYREAIEYIKLELRDFRKDANTIKKLSRDRIVQGEAFRLSCDIRDCLKALESEE